MFPFLPPFFGRWNTVVAPTPVRRRFEQFHCLYIERWIGRWRKLNDSLPETVKTEEEFNFFRFHHLARVFHRSIATGAVHRILAPCLENEFFGWDPVGVNQDWLAREWSLRVRPNPRQYENPFARDHDDSISSFWRPLLPGRAGPHRDGRSRF